MKLLTDALKSYKNLPLPYFWTSGCDFEGNKNFYWWGTGKHVTYAEWWPGQPDNFEGRELCMLLGYGFEKQKFGLNDDDIRLAYPYICEYYEQE